MGVARMEYEAGRGPGRPPRPGVEDRLWPAGVLGGLVFKEHLGIVVRQVEEATREPNRDRVGGIQSKEPDAGITATYVYVRSYIGLVKARKSRDGRKTDWPHAASW